MKLLGISCYYHDSAACLVDDGRIVAAAQEERFTRKKHDAGFPFNAVRYCLAEGGVTDGGPDGLDGVVFYDKPLLKFHRILETYLAVVPRGLRSYVQAVPLWLKEKLWIPPEIQEALERCGVARAGRRSTSPSTTSRTPRAPSTPRPSRRRRCSPSTASASGPPPPSASARARRLAADPRDRLPPLAGPALLGVHLLHRLQGQLRRVQADGPRALRRADATPTPSGGS